MELPRNALPLLIKDVRTGKSIKILDQPHSTFGHLRGLDLTLHLTSSMDAEAGEASLIEEADIVASSK